MTPAGKELGNRRKVVRRLGTATYHTVSQLPASRLGNRDQWKYRRLQWGTLQ